MSIDRRRLLQSAAGALAASAWSGCGPSAAPGPTLQDLDAAAASATLDLDGLTSPVIIDSIRLLRKENEHFIHIRSSDGAEGISVTNSRAAQFHPILEEQVIPFLLGKDAREWESKLRFELYRYESNYKLQGLAFWCAHAWVEFALLDMLGRIAGKSIGDLLGGVVRETAPFYVASGRRDTTPEEEVDYLAELIEETGAHAVKFRLGGRMSRNEDALPGRTQELIPLVRKAFGGDLDIHGDANSSYDPPEAIRIGQILQEANAVFYEEPCPFDHLEDTKVVTDTLTIPVAGGEEEFSERRFRWMIHNRGVDIVQPDLHYYGGMLRSIRVARMAERAGMPTTPHISGGFGFIYMMHFVSCVNDVGRYQEYKRNIERYRDWFDPKLEIKDGALSIPTGPGVGIVSIADVIEGAETVIGE